MKPKKNLKWFIEHTLRYGAAAGIVLFLLSPILILTYLALAPQEVVYGFPKPISPASFDFSFENIKFFWGAFGTQSALWNSIVVAILTVILSTALGAPAGYALARYTFVGKDSYRLTIVTTRAFPVVILAVPLIVTYINWGLDDTVIGVALLHTAMALPLSVLVTSTVFAGVPPELESAAMTMGCSRAEAFFRVVMPLALPGLAASSIFAFVLSWNEVFGAAVLTTTNRTLPALLISQLGSASIPYKFAGGFFILAPALIFMLLVRKYLFNLWGVKLK